MEKIGAPEQSQWSTGGPDESGGRGIHVVCELAGSEGRAGRRHTCPRPAPLLRASEGGARAGRQGVRRATRPGEARHGGSREGVQAGTESGRAPCGPVGSGIEGEGRGRDQNQGRSGSQGEGRGGGEAPRPSPW